MGQFGRQEDRHLSEHRGTDSRYARRPVPPVSPGVYLARLTVDGEPFEQEIKVIADPESPAAMLFEELNEHERKRRPKFVQ